MIYLISCSISCHSACIYGASYGGLSEWWLGRQNWSALRETCPIATLGTLIPNRLPWKSPLSKEINLFVMDKVAHHVMWAPWIVDGGYFLQTWRVAVNVLN